MLYLNGTSGYEEAASQDLTLTSVVFELVISPLNDLMQYYLTLTSVVFE